MTNFFASIAKNGLRETISMLFHGETTLFKRPPQTRPQYARVRRRTKNGRRTRPAIYQFSSTIEGGRGMMKTYERIDDGEPLDENEIDQFVTAKKSASCDKRQSQRMTRKEKPKRRALELEQMAVESSQLDESINERHHAPNSRHIHSRTSAGTSDQGHNRTKPARNGIAEASQTESGSQAQSVVFSSRPHEQSIRSQTSRPRATGHVSASPSFEGTRLASQQQNAHLQQTSQVYASREGTHPSQRSRSKQKRPVHLRADVFADPPGPAIRQVHFTEPNPSSGSLRPLEEIPEDASGSPSSFRQPEMDEQGSRSFVFGTPTHALGFSTSTISRPPSTATASLQVEEGRTDYVRGPDANIYAVDHRSESLQLVPDEEPTPTIGTIGPGGASTPLPSRPNPSLQPASIRAGPPQAHATNGAMAGGKV